MEHVNFFHLAGEESNWTGWIQFNDYGKNPLRDYHIVQVKYNDGHIGECGFSGRHNWYDSGLRRIVEYRTFLVEWSYPILWNGSAGDRLPLLNDGSVAFILELRSGMKIMECPDSASYHYPEDFDWSIDKVDEDIVSYRVLLPTSAEISDLSRFRKFFASNPII